MKILFLCGSLENGKDGVGDYTRRLAGEIIRQGHSASIIALNDRHIFTIEQTVQESDGIKIPVLRLPSVLSNKEKYNKAGKFIEDFDPEWLSLQFVPYAFNKYGLPFGLGKHLAKIGKGRKWHIMFHELWIGMAEDSSLRFRIIGFIMKQIVKHLIITLHPNHIDTNITLYQKQLQKVGFSSNVLSLFGNIPVLGNKQKKNNKELIFILFGNIHYGADLENFTDWLLDIQKNENNLVIVWFVGKNGLELNSWSNALQEKNVYFKVYAKQNESVISKLMLQADIGITTTPYCLVEKSGAVAAMLEHKLPIVCVAREWIPQNIDTNFRHNIIYWRPEIKLEDIIKQPIHSHHLRDIAKLFLYNISN